MQLLGSGKQYTHLKATIHNCNLVKYDLAVLYGLESSSIIYNMSLQCTMCNFVIHMLQFIDHVTKLYCVYYIGLNMAGMTCLTMHVERALATNLKHH